MQSPLVSHSIVVKRVYDKKTNMVILTSRQPKNSPLIKPPLVQTIKVGTYVSNNGRVRPDRSPMLEPVPSINIASLMNKLADNAELFWFSVR